MAAPDRKRTPLSEILDAITAAYDGAGEKADRLQPGRTAFHQEHKETWDNSYATLGSHAFNVAEFIAIIAEDRELAASIVVHDLFRIAAELIAIERAPTQDATLIDPGRFATAAFSVAADTKKQIAAKAKEGWVEVNVNVEVTGHDAEVSP